MTEAYLTIVGATYVVLAAWCSVAPGSTSNKVGFKLEPGSGESEFFVIYGGLELALGLFFLWPWIEPEMLDEALLLAVILHACIVVFRTVGFFRFSGIGSTTRILAVFEWIILIAGAALLWQART